VTKITHRTVKANGISIHIAEAGDGPLVLMLHGFPELWYSWRHQLPALAAAGYHAVAPDVRGYGGSDAPHEIEAYSTKNLVADAVGILDALGEESAVIVGHDWSAPTAWNSAVLHPERYRAVVGLSVPFLPRAPMPPTRLLKARFRDNFFYMLYFQEPGPPEVDVGGFGFDLLLAELGKHRRDQRGAGSNSVSTAGMSMPSLKRSTEKSTLTRRAARSFSAAARSLSGLSAQTATAGIPDSRNTRAMNRACSTLTQKPNARICRGSSTRPATCASTCLAQALFDVRRFESPSTS